MFPFLSCLSKKFGDSFILSFFFSFLFTFSLNFPFRDQSLNLVNLVKGLLTKFVV
jgi:hypothetical protein